MNKYLDMKNQVIHFLSPKIKQLLLNCEATELMGLEELRIRAYKPLVLIINDNLLVLGENGKISNSFESAYIVTADDVIRTLAAISDNSYYAFEEDIKRGYITISGGHRVGLAGQVVIDERGQVLTMKNINSLCFRIAKEVQGCSKAIIPYIYKENKSINNTLIISPPRCGKTTILRDLARIIANGSSGKKAMNVAIIDERSELAGSYNGQPQLDIGIHADVLDSCPKASGMMMALRSLAPQIIVTDEIGSNADVAAIFECLNAGVSVISTIHAGSFEEVYNRAVLKPLLSVNAFRVGILLSRRNGPGSIEEVKRWD